jgi:hypothetical protein
LKQVKEWGGVVEEREQMAPAGRVNVREGDEKMGVAEEIRSYLEEEVGARVDGKGQGGSAKLVLAQQKSFLSKKTVEYVAKFKVQDDDRVVRFFEMLKESGSGMSAGDGDVGGGWGVSKETYKSGLGGREASIEAQGSLLGKKYAFTFDYARVRTAIKDLAERHGYRFDYQVTPKGL